VDAPPAAIALKLALRRATDGEPDGSAFRRGHGRGWGCGAQLTGHQMRAHLTICARPPTASEYGTAGEEPERQAWPPTAAANAVRLALRLRTHGEPDAGAFHGMPGTSAYSSPPVSPNADLGQLPDQRRKSCPLSE
jgi:hypothetical protein